MSAPPSAVAVTVRRTGRRFDAEANLLLPADERAVWDTITDYGALPQFMPGIGACAVLEQVRTSAQRETLVVEQQGEFRFLLYSQPLKVRLHIEHCVRRSAHATAVRFDLGALARQALKSFEGRYELAAAGSKRAPTTRLRYTAVIELGLPPPPGIGALAVRKALTVQLAAVAAEIGRRTGT